MRLTSPQCLLPSAARSPKAAFRTIARTSGACSSTAAGRTSRASLAFASVAVRGVRGATIRCQSAPSDGASVADGSVSVVLLAGGVGKRMKATMPKQYLPLRGQPIATYSLQTFATMKEVGEIVIVCDPSYKDIFEDCKISRSVPIKWALPGKERQDSVFNGLQQVRPGAALVAVHDSARPLVEAADVSRCIGDAAQVGAAVLGVQVKPTIKEVGADGMVIKTLDRSRLWEVQTPQVIRPELLRAGYDKVNNESLAVTDDVSIIEHLGRPVKVTLGDYTNIKVTTPEDMAIAERFIDEKSAKLKATATAHA